MRRLHTGAGTTGATGVTGDDGPTGRHPTPQCTAQLGPSKATAVGLPLQVNR